MKSERNPEKLIRGLRRHTSAQKDQQILNDAFAALQDTVGRKQNARDYSLWLLTGGVVAAAVVIILLAVTAHQNGPKKPTGVFAVNEPDKIEETQDLVEKKPAVAIEKKLPEKKQTVKLENEIRTLLDMYATKDVNGFLEVVAEADVGTRLLAVYLLGEVGNANALEVLEELSTAYDGNTPDPFAEAAAKIRKRLEMEKEKKTEGKEIKKKEKKPTAKKQQKIEGVVYRGTVRDEHGEGIEGVQVRCVDYDHDTGLRRQKIFGLSNKEGTFEAGPLPVQRRRLGRCLIFEHPDYSIGWVRMFPSANFDKDNVKVTLFEPARVGGRVVDKQGEPVEGATVTAEVRIGYNQLDLDGRNGLAVQTDAKGWFMFEQIPEPARLHIEVMCKGYARYTTRTYGKPAPGTYPVRAGQEDLEIVLEPGGCLKGQLVLNGKNYERKGILVWASKPESKSCRARTDANGAFEIIGLGTGSYKISIWARSILELTKAGLVCEPVLVDIDLQEDGLPLTLELKEGFRVPVRVYDQDTGGGVPNTWVSASLKENNEIQVSSGQTDFEGRCSLSLRPGEYTLVVYGWEEGRRSKFSKDFEIMDNNEINGVEIGIKSRPYVAGWLVDSNNNPVVGQVHLDYGISPAKTDANGAFVAPEPHYYGRDDKEVCFAFDAQKKRGRMFLWDPNEVTNDIEIQVEPLAQIRGRIVDEKGNPINWAEPELHIMLSKQRGRCVHFGNWLWKLDRDEDGEFLFKDVPVGLPLKVFVEGRGGQESVVIEKLPAGETFDVGNMVLKPDKEFVAYKNQMDGKLTGQVFDANNQPLAGIKVQVLARWSSDSITDTTDLNGRYEFEGLPRGKRLSIMLQTQDYLPDHFWAECDGNDFDMHVFRRKPRLIKTDKPEVFIKKLKAGEAVKLFGMKLVTVTAELQHEYDLYSSKGALVLDPGPHYEHLDIGTLRRGSYFRTIGKKEIASVEEMVFELMRIHNKQRSSMAEGGKGHVRVVFVTGDRSSTQYIRIDENNEKDLKAVCKALKEAGYGDAGD